MAQTNIPARLHSVAKGNIVTGANEILDDEKGKKQSTINTETDETLAELSRAITRINDTLHEGALYAGYATPETIPTEHEGASLFYIATEAGEYIHFFSN